MHSFVQAFDAFLKYNELANALYDNHLHQVAASEILAQTREAIANEKRYLDNCVLIGNQAMWTTYSCMRQQEILRDQMNILEMLNTVGVPTAQRV